MTELDSASAFFRRLCHSFSESVGNSAFLVMSDSGPGDSRDYS